MLPSWYLVASHDLYPSPSFLVLSWEGYQGPQIFGQQSLEGAQDLSAQHTSDTVVRAVHFSMAHS